MLMDMQEIVETIQRDKKHSPSGVSAIFVRLSDKWAIKLYTSKEDRDLSYERQEKAAKLGLGPDVGECLDISCLDDPFGYITEIVETLVASEDQFNELSDQEQDELEERIMNETYEERQNIYHTFKKKLNWLFIDDHMFNYGRKNGKLVVIDFCDVPKD